MCDEQGGFLRPPHGTTPAAVKANRNIKVARILSSFASSGNVQKTESGS